MINDKHVSISSELSDYKYFSVVCFKKGRCYKYPEKLTTTIYIYHTSL